MTKHKFQHLRSSTPALKGKMLEFFYEIMVLCECDIKPYIANNFNSPIIKDYLLSKDRKNNPILVISSNIYDDRPLRISELRFKKGNNIGISLLYNLRNAFAHNRITIEKDTEILVIENYYGKRLMMRGRIKYKVLKEFIDLLLGRTNTKKLKF